MWEKSLPPSPSKMFNEEINRKYESKEKRLLTEINREKLPAFAESMKKREYMDLQPFYQRRLRWDKDKQSRLIESFLINIPVPPIILFEKEYNSYEVMDGQQRMTAIKDFYENKLQLSGFELWPELNGCTYADLPSKIQAGIDRRSISTIVIIAESTDDPEEALFFKQKIFERLNSGGENLSHQEIRNCLYSGRFNELLLELARHPIFAEAWGIPRDDNDPQLGKNNYYKKMEDAELVLRFFALRNVDKFRSGMEGFLDIYMMKSIQFSEEDITVLKGIFQRTLDLAHEIYGEYLFKPFEPEKGIWKERAYKAYYDATMVGLSKHLNQAEVLIKKRLNVIERTKKLFTQPEAIFLAGGGNSKVEIQKRIKLFEQMVLQVIGE